MNTRRLLIVLLIFSILGCDNPKTPDMNESSGLGWTNLDYKGHQYLLYRESFDVNGSIIHNPDCSCTKKL